jgi:opacity protein-like surface antigen
MSRRFLVLLPALALACASTASASRFEAGGHILVASPTGEFDKVAGTGYGIQGFGVLNFDPMGWIGLRLDAGYVNYGNEDYDVPLSTTVPVTVRVSTTNNIALLGLGPHLSVPTGPVRPYAYGTVGLGYFFTQTSARDRGTGEAFATDTQHSSAAFAWSAGGGFKIPVARVISIDVGVEYRTHQGAKYLTEGGVTQDAGTGDILVDVQESDVDLVLYRVGVAYSSPF